jgi:hypothetical protein
MPFSITGKSPTNYSWITIRVYGSIFCILLVYLVPTNIPPTTFFLLHIYHLPSDSMTCGYSPFVHHLKWVAVKFEYSRAILLPSRPSLVVWSSMYCFFFKFDPKFEYFISLDLSSLGWNLHNNTNIAYIPRNLVIELWYCTETIGKFQCNIIIFDISHFCWGITEVSCIPHYILLRYHISNINFRACKEFQHVWNITLTYLFKVWEKTDLDGHPGNGHMASIDGQSGLGNCW